jgi:hypothetical protein
MRLRCFVAMAFGKPDTDRLYTRVVQPLLRELKITAVRVDRKEHNQNVNEVIINELKAAHIVVADLTYSRPSVYFEAGYAEREVPVIYCVRRDHLPGNGPPGEPGFRVHFDVSMRNIIAWTPRGGAAFKESLRRRVLHVTKPIVADFERKRVAKAAASDFRSSPEPAQREAIRSRLAEFLEERRFKPEESLSEYNIYVRRRGGHLRTITLVFGRSLTASNIEKAVRTITRDLWVLDGRVLRTRTRSTALASVEHNILVASAANIQVARLKGKYPNAHVVPASSVIWWQPMRADDGMIGGRPGIDVTMRLHILGQLSSAEAVVERVRSLASA